MRWLWVRARAFVHATEDEDRVRDAVLWSLGHLDRDGAQDRVERKRFKGHWGNDIVQLEAVFKRAEDVAASIQRLLQDPATRDALRDTLLRRLDEDDVLHIRLDKQAAVECRLALTEGGDAIVLQTKALRDPPETALQVWRRILGITAE